MPISKAKDADKLKTDKLKVRRRPEPVADRGNRPEETSRKRWVRGDEENLRDRESLFWRGIWMTVF
ncbi:hypothetical protein J2Z50_002546 [Ensifer mexicanus]|nr:hypothetical protein [Sinorhizobium mexicanum]